MRPSSRQSRAASERRWPLAQPEYPSLIPALPPLWLQGNEYNFHFMAKGGGSANKTYLYQETKALLNEPRMLQFLEEKIMTIGTSACPPYHLAIVIGGLSAEMTLKTVKYASARYYDNVFQSGSAEGRAFRDLDLEAKVLGITQRMGIGAQFGGKYFCHDVRVIRLPRHGASCPVGIGVSCSADRQARLTRACPPFFTRLYSPSRWSASVSALSAPPCRRRPWERSLRRASSSSSSRRTRARRASGQSAADTPQGCRDLLALRCSFDSAADGGVFRASITAVLA